MSITEASLLVLLLLFMAYWTVCLYLHLKLQRIRRHITDWHKLQGHEACWYMPDLFQKIAAEVGLDDLKFEPPQISRKQFDSGCREFADELFKVR